MAAIQNIIPGLSKTNFEKILKSVGINRYTVFGDDRIFLDYDRPNNRQILQALEEILRPYGVRYVAPKKDVAYLNVASTRSKIYTKAKSTNNSMLMKPQKFGRGRSRITNREIPYKNYPDEILNAIETTTALTSHQKDILRGLILRINNVISKNELKTIFDNLGRCVRINTLNNDFGEVLGPIAILENNMLPIDKSTAVVYLPERGNEPLLDYKITDSERVYKISAKSGPTTNTLKPGHIKELIDIEDHLFNKYKRTHQYQVLRILHENSIKEGPIEVVKFLKERRYSGLDWVDPRTVAYSEETRQLAENDIMRISKEQLDFTDIFFDAIMSKIFYVKFRMDKTGRMEWKLVNDKRPKPTPGRFNRITFRSKNSIGKPKSKLGLQP